jgi:hypothetical protein
VNKKSHGKCVKEMGDLVSIDSLRPTMRLSGQYNIRIETYPPINREKKDRPKSYGFDSIHNLKRSGFPFLIHPQLPQEAQTDK